MKTKSSLKVYRLVISIFFIGLYGSNLVPQVFGKYPEKNIRVIMHTPPGGGIGAMARLVLRYAREKLDTRFIIENHKGAGGQIGYTMLSMAKPDGYTIGTISTMSFVSHELIRKGVKYTLHDSFIPIARIVQMPSCLSVLVDSPYKSLNDLIKDAKESPGKVSWGGTMKWGTHHVHMAMLEMATNVKMTYVPFDGISETRTYLLGGHLDVAAGGLAVYAPLVEQGKLRILAVGSAERSSLLPDAPTYKELGYDIEISSDRCFAAPAGTPKEYIDILSNAFKEVMEEPAFLEDAKKIGIYNVLEYMNSADLRNYLLNLQNTMREMVKIFKKK
jgi:tripartite-type tricarboxylate transporter receptor subunit TctC